MSTTTDTTGRVTPPDAADWMVRRIRTEFTPQVPGLQVDVRVPDNWRGQCPLVVVRDDGGAQHDLVLFDRQLGVTVYYGPVEDPKPCRDLAAQVYASLTDLRIPTEPGPVTAIDLDGCNGPYAATAQQPTACEYLTVSYTLYGHIS